MDANFALKLTLQTPLISGFTPLDAVIARLLSDDLGGDWQRAHEELPFKTINGVLCCSAPIFQSYQDTSFNRVKKKDDEPAKMDVFPGINQGFCAKLKPNDIDTDHIEPNGKKGTTWVYGTSRVRECGNVLDYYPTLIAQDVWYFGITNNAELLERLIDNIEGLGKKRGHGYGAVVKEKTHFYIDSGSVNGILDHDGTPLRPFPVSAGIKVKKDAMQADCGWKPAYWDINNRAQCYIPDSPRIVKTFNHIKEML